MSADNGGLIASLKGKAKQVMGSVTGDSDLEQVGRLEQRAAETAREAKVLERDAEQTEQKAAVDAELAEAEVDAERLDAEHCRLREQFFGAARSPEKREVRGRLQLDIARAAHAKIPCRYQRCEPVSPCSPSPAR